ncbi:MAG: amidohydrolase family protein, partial [Lentisphaeria bacterium]|nr:amidohydrolase family protein [Lentisphaeria bacterium]
LSDLVKTTSWNQACALRLPDLGRLEPGYFADITVLDNDFNVVMTLVNGEVRYQK